MKKYNLLFSILFSALLLSGCQPGEQDNGQDNPPLIEEHVHEFSSDYQFDETNHWHQATCGHTNLTEGLEEHTFDQSNKCKCGYEKVIGHEHTYESTYSSNLTHHWKEATCEHDGLISEFGEHKFDSQNKCETCGFIKHNCVLTGNLAYIEPNDFVASLLPESFESSSTLIGAMISALVEMSYGEEGELILARQSFEYESIGFDGNPITLSGAITIPKFNGQFDINFVDIDSHPTFTDKVEAVSYGPDIYSVFSVLGGLSLEFDLIGFGSTYYLPADYHCRHLMVKNTIDGILAAEHLLKENFNISITDYPQILTGYSQGGYDALALLRYLEEEASEEVKSFINPVYTFVGSGAYDLKLMIEESLANPTFMYPEYILMGIITAKYYHPEIFGEHEIEEFLTDYGKRFIKPIINKDDAAIQALKLEENDQGELLYKQPSDFFSEEFLSNDKGQELKAIVDGYCEEENLLDGKWMPKGKVCFFYSEDDEIVTPKCSEKAAELFKDLPNVEFELGYEDHRTFALTYYLSIVGYVGELLELAE